MAKMHKVAKKSFPMNYLILFGFSAVGLARLLYGITQNEYFSESNTNAYNLYF